MKTSLHSRVVLTLGLACVLILSGVAGVASGVAGVAVVEVSSGHTVTMNKLLGPLAPGTQEEILPW